MTQHNKRAQWQAHIEAWQQSNQTQKAYCQSEGISLAAFGYWRKRLSKPKAQKLLQLGSASSTTLARLHVPGDIVIDIPVNHVAVLLPLIQQAVRSND